VISRMCDLVMIRTFQQEIVERFAANSRVPVINGLTNEYHPCQVLADIYNLHRAARADPGQDGGVDRRLEQRVHPGCRRRRVQFQTCTSRPRPATR